MYLYSKKPHLDRLFHFQRWVFGIQETEENLSNLPIIHLSGNFEKKLIKMAFIIKIYYISSSNDPNITHTKNHISG